MTWVRRVRGVEGVAEVVVVVVVCGVAGLDGERTICGMDGSCRSEWRCQRC